MFLSSSYLLALLPLLAVVQAQACPTIPDLSSYNNTVLPDLFTFLNGQKVLTLADWECRKKEMGILLQQDELGVIPPPPEFINASFSGTTLTITVTNAGKSITFAPTIQYPKTGTAPFPALIGMGGISIPSPAGVAIINFNNEQMAQQDTAASRGLGLFFNLYGADASAGAMSAWAWAVTVIMDALEQTPAARINTARVGVSGCSRNGKGALVAGAFEPRLVLTIPQESGSGGTDSWRISDFILSTGILTQTASEIVQENVWLGSNFDQFANTSVDKLPFDHHSLGALVAPRGLFVIDNAGFDWLGPFSSFGAMVSARTAWTAMGATDAMGISQAANHTHCVFPATQQPQVNAFINKFLFDQPTDTDIVETAGDYTFEVPNAQWAPWSVPTF
ncbi:Glucuronoyl esterase catalytic domain from Hypocrea Jecorina [Mycena alexandri]|uniref:(4-O-methyl)-D-glucuronate--lignin esterase n=1 Tax=Mycena alexandri TaxID=1745969 RepID=A0AAD6TCL9_9AGAR|nr:Glucuronoyl esterase catalytic domain from Hypocrea Jecorina [Mycena alexandri]